MRGQDHGFEHDDGPAWSRGTPDPGSSPDSATAAPDPGTDDTDDTSGDSTTGEPLSTSDPASGSGDSPLPPPSFGHSSSAPGPDPAASEAGNSWFSRPTANPPVFPEQPANP